MKTDAGTYIFEFTELNVDKKGNKIAPHKAILLLTIIDLINTGDINSPFVPLSGTVEMRFKTIWERYVKEDSHYKCRIVYPFFHLSSSSFWKLQKLTTYEYRDDYTSLSMLKKHFAGALINQNLFKLLSKQETQNELKQILIDTYLQPSAVAPKKIAGSLLTLALALFCVA